ncbi:hypothetical protein XENOCAPTIV_000168 [Xenoophorus captivus]|uniref:Uncharacterized protein n=1 Tax=Xenoophorus captivus TaxID=1517983 RepID=A0ABV0QVN8_9TELE
MSRVKSSVQGAHIFSHPADAPPPLSGPLSPLRRAWKYPPIYSPYISTSRCGWLLFRSVSSYPNGLYPPNKAETLLFRSRARSCQSSDLHPNTPGCGVHVHGSERLRHC